MRHGDNDADAAKAEMSTFGKSRLAALDNNGSLDGPILEIETSGKTILYPQKESYGVFDIVLATGIGTRNARSRILKISAANNQISNHLTASPQLSFTENTFIDLATKLTPPIPRRKKRLLMKDVQLVLPNEEIIIINTTHPGILQKLIERYGKGRISHADFADININTFHAFLRSSRKCLPAGWKIITHETTPPGQEHKCEYELIKAEDNIPAVPQLPEDKTREEKQPQTVKEPVRISLNLTEDAKGELARMKKRIRSGLTELLLSHLVNGTQPQSKAWEFIEPLILLHTQDSRKIMRIVPFADQNIVREIILEYFELGIRELIGKGSSSPLKTYQYCKQLEKKGYTLERILEEASNFFPREKSDITI